MQCARKKNAKGRPLNFRKRKIHGRQNHLENELQRHCEEVYEDFEEVIEVQENRIKKYKTDGDRQFAEEGSVAASTVYLNGPVGSIVSEVGKQLPPEKNREITCFQDRLLGFMEDCIIEVLSKA